MGMEHSAQRGDRRAKVSVAILALLIAYGVALAVGWPQRGTQVIVGHSGHASGPAASQGCVAPPPWTVLPFVLLLAGIAVLPLIPATTHWWESNLNRFKVAGGLALLTLAYYAFLHHAAIEGHWPAHHVVTPSQSGMQTELVNTIL